MYQKLTAMFFFTLFLVLCGGGCCNERSSAPAKPTTLILSEPANGKDFKTNVGDRIWIRLNENPTTGYCWSYKISNPAAFKVLSDKYVPPSSRLMGAPGYHLTVLQSAMPGAGATEIEFSYARPWEKGIAPIQVWKVNIFIRK